MADSAGSHGDPQGGGKDVARRAADLASEASEGALLPGRRLAAPLAQAARSGVRAAGQRLRRTRRRVSAAGARTASSGAVRDRLAGQVLAMAMRLRVRDQAALRAQFPGLAADEIADALIEGAARAAAVVGGAAGVWAAIPALTALPAELATETLALVGIEVKLVAELHEAYGMPAPGSAADRMTAYLAAWAHRRGVFLAPGGLVLAAGSPLARRLRRRLAARAGESAFSLAPLFTGAAAGVLINRREARLLGEEVRADLRRRGG